MKSTQDLISLAGVYGTLTDIVTSILSIVAAIFAYKTFKSQADATRSQAEATREQTQLNRITLSSLIKSSLPDITLHTITNGTNRDFWLSITFNRNGVSKLSIENKSDEGVSLDFFQIPESVAAGSKIEIKVRIDDDRWAATVLLQVKYTTFTGHTFIQSIQEGITSGSLFLSSPMEVFESIG